jgi:hypothetical protein
MMEHDEFANALFEEAKRFLEKAKAAEAKYEQQAYLHASLLLGFCALEAHVNGVARDFGSFDKLTIHEKGLLLEKDVRLEHGTFVIRDGLKISRLEERILFLHQKFSATELDRSSAMWAELKTASEIRNDLTHSKKAVELDCDKVKRAMQAVLDVTNSLFKAVYKVDYPLLNFGLQSQLEF